MGVTVLRTPLPDSDFWRPHPPWVVDRWEVLVGEKILAQELDSRLLAAAYLNEKYSHSDNTPEPEPEFVDLDSLD